MWRPLARRVLPLFNAQVSQSHHGILATIEPPLSFSNRSNFNLNPRFFSSDSSEIHDESTFLEFENACNNMAPPSESPISEASETADDFDFTAKNNAEDLNFVPVEDLEGQKNGNDSDKVESLLSLLQSTVDGSLESSLEEMGLVLDEEFVSKVLETPHVPGENLIGFFGWVSKKPGFKVSTQVLEVLVSSVCKENRKKHVYALWDLVNEVGEKEKGVVNVKILNELIAQFSRLGKGKAAFEVFNKFEEFGCLHDADTYYLAVEALCKRSFYNWACSVWEEMLAADKLPNADGVGKIISFMCKGGKAREAHTVYLSAKEKKIDPPRSSIDYLINSLSQMERTKKGSDTEIDKELEKETVSLALDMLNQYPAEDRKYATKPFSNVVKKLCWIEDVDRANKLLLEMVESGPPPANATFNCVINRLAKIGNMEEAKKIMKLMESRGLKPDIYTYSVIMSGYTRAGAMEEACEVYEEAKKMHSKLCPITYHTLIRGFCKLEQFDKAVDLLGEMRQHGVNPNHDEYNKLIKSLCLKALDWETAEKLQEEMRLNGVVLNGRTKALITAVKELKGEDIKTEQPVLA